MRTVAEPFATLTSKQIELLAALGSAGVRHVVIGGYAMRFFGCLRPAKDLDLLVGYESTNAERLFRVLATMGNIDPVSGMAKLCKPLMQIRWFEVELLTSIEGLEFADVSEAALPVKWKGLRLLVASREHMLKAKKLASRPEDISDIQFLEGLAHAV